jgi:selenocysteine lyase/cysteine desulfurase
MGDASASPPDGASRARALLLASARRVAAVRASIIGDAECLPCALGPRKLTYADVTAAGRASALVEAPLARLVLPLRANAHTHTSLAGAQSGAFLEEARYPVGECD